MRCAALLCFVMMSLSSAADVLRVHSANPRYLEWKGRPVALVGSGEHYGALVNLDFDFVRYFATLKNDGLNVTRVFSGAAYVEPQGAFDIERNTLAPAPGRYLPPWGKTDREGLWNLDEWNEHYFARLRALVAEADKAGVIVEFTLYCPFYPDKDDKTKSPMWPLSPFHPANRVTPIGGTSHEKIHTLEADPRVLAAQERFVKRVVEELKDAGNLYYEICNEPYICAVPMAWQERMVEVYASLTGDRALNEVMEDAQRRLAALDLPAGYRVYDIGAFTELQEGRQIAGLLLALALFLVFVVMAVQYESLRNPLVILLSVPFAATGPALALPLLGVPLSMPVWLGLIMLAGIVVNNAIVLVEYIELLRAKGRSAHEAIATAGELRLRPILMTTLTTVVGLLPLSLGWGEGAEMLQPLAQTMVWGLSFSLLVSLLLVPVVYLGFHRIAPPASGAS